MFTAYFDEGNDDKVYLIGGWLGDDGVWENFSQAWNLELSAVPSIKYFKNNEAMGDKEQFAGWTEQSRDEKLLALAEIIAQHELVGLVGGVGIAKFNSLFAGSKVPKKVRRSIVKLTEPYHLACHCEIVKAKNSMDRVNFIFDEGVRFLDDCVENYPNMLSIMPLPAQGIAGTVDSKNDRLTPALQAADMLVGQALLTLRTGSDSKVVDVLKARKIEQFSCLTPHLTSIPKSMERLNEAWAAKQLEKSRKKAERDKIHKAKR
jgi:hypothetical protein